MAILKVRDNNGNIIEIPAIKGDKGDSATATDVQINSVSIVENGVANIPAASKDNLGVVKVSEGNGIKLSNDNTLVIANAQNSRIDARNSNYNPIVPNNLDYAVKQAMCDGKGTAWTNQEKAMARARFGLEWKLVDTIEVTDVTQVEITFPQEYNEFMVIADISGSGASMFYPIYGYVNNSEPTLKNRQGLHSDFYPGEKDEHYELIFEKMSIENDTYFRVSGFEKTDFEYPKLKQNIQTTGWKQVYDVTNDFQCHCFCGVRFSRTITNATFKIYAR